MSERTGLEAVCIVYGVDFSFGISRCFPRNSRGVSIHQKRLHLTLKLVSLAA